MTVSDERSNQSRTSPRPPTWRLLLSAIGLLFAVAFAAYTLWNLGSGGTPGVEIPSWAKVAPEQIAEAKKYGVPVAFENDIGMRFVLIPAGTFLMGSPEYEEGRGDYETQHEVSISRPFYMSIYEVTNERYRVFDPLHKSDAILLPDCDQNAQPALVGHAGARHFAAWLTERDPSRAVRLPTMAEWGRARYAGARQPYWWGPSADDAYLHENVGDASMVKRLTIVNPGYSYEDCFKGDDGYPATAPVGSLSANPWGLYDVLGNVSEWCADARSRPDHGDPTQTVLELAVCGPCYDSDPRELSGPMCRWADSVEVSDLIGHGFRLVSPLPEPGER